MQQKVRMVMLKMVDKELRHFRLAAKQNRETQEMLRTVRHLLRIPVAEMEEKMGICRSVIFELENSEARGTITMRSLGRMAEAMDCKAIYAIVPENGGTLEDLAVERMWRNVLGSGFVDKRRTVEEN